MISNNNNSGKITSGINPRATAEKTIEFIYNQLPMWRIDPARPPHTSEDRMNLHLCKFLQAAARLHLPMISFFHEEYQLDRRRVDLSACPASKDIFDDPITIYDPILLIECKRLPAPSNARDREYVSGGYDNFTGGIQRFRLGLHGASLSLVAMIGYVQEETLAYWFNMINNWIEEFALDPNADNCPWSSDDRLALLDQNNVDDVSMLSSSHTREHQDQCVTIKHIWAIM